MSALERELHALAAWVELPGEVDLGPGLRSRLSRPRYRRGLVIALAALLLAIGIAFAVSPARSSILRFLGLKGVTIEYVARLPSVPVHHTLPLGPPLSLAEARRDLPWRVLASGLLGEPDEVHFREGQLAFVYERDDDLRLVVTQALGFGVTRFIEKLLQPGTRIARVSIYGQPGYFISGKPHFFLYQQPNGLIVERDLYLAGDTLVWEHGQLTLRMEGKLARAQAVEIARSFR